MGREPRAGGDEGAWGRTAQGWGAMGGDGGGSPGEGEHGGGQHRAGGYEGAWGEVAPGWGAMREHGGGLGRLGETFYGWGATGGDPPGVGGDDGRSWMVGGGLGWLGETFYGWGEKRRFHIVGGAWIYIGAKHYTQSNGGASRMTSPPFNLGDIYIHT